MNDTQFLSDLIKICRSLYFSPFYLSLCLSINLYVFNCVFISVSLYLCLSFSLHQSVYLCLWLIPLCFSLSLFMFLYRYLSLCIHSSNISLCLVIPLHFSLSLFIFTYHSVSFLYLYSVSFCICSSVYLSPSLVDTSFRISTTQIKVGTPDSSATAKVHLTHEF